jgi:hypothetical protein
VGAGAPPDGALGLLSDWKSRGRVLSLAAPGDFATAVVGAASSPSPGDDFAGLGGAADRLSECAHAARRANATQVITTSVLERAIMR